MASNKSRVVSTFLVRAMRSPRVSVDFKGRKRLYATVFVATIFFTPGR